MSYRDEIKKAQMLPLAELYEIRNGGSTQRYTSYRDNVVYQGNTYYAAAIQRSNLSKDSQLKSVRCTITMPLTDVAQKYIANTPVQPTDLKITSVFVGNDSLSIKVFEGALINIVMSQGQAQAEFESSSRVYRCKIPRIVHQARCNHTLFDAGCTLLSEDYKEPAVVTVSGRNLASVVFASHANGWYTLGRVQAANGDQRLITNHAGNTITLQSPFDSSVIAGVSVYVWPGCNKAAATCKSKFDNFDNFVGFPYIPSNNPVIWGFER